LRRILVVNDQFTAAAWEGEEVWALRSDAEAAGQTCQTKDSLKGLAVRKAVLLASFLGFAHGVSALAFPFIVPSNLLYTAEYSLHGQVQILTPAW